MSATAVLEIIRLVNALLGIVRATGISMKTLMNRISIAHADGRPFDQNDVEALGEQATAALARLEQTVAAGKAKTASKATATAPKPAPTPPEPGADPDKTIRPE